MLIELLTTTIVFLCFLIVLAVLLQEGKGDMGLGSASRQMLFGGSGGQNILEKITWVLGFLFIALALGLTIAKTKEHHRSVVSSFVGGMIDDGPLAQSQPAQQPIGNEQAATVIASSSAQAPADIENTPADVPAPTQSA